MSGSPVDSLNAAVVMLPEGQLPDLSGAESEILKRLGSATGFRVPGRDRRQCRVVNTLLHGNEPSGFRAVITWLRGGVRPAVDVVFTICSVEAALGPPLYGHRALPGHRDANRCFFPPFEGLEGQRALSLLTLIDEAQPEALIDLHNTTGHTPAYGVGTRLDEAELGLTALFADRLMHSDLRLGTLTEAVSDRVPSVVIECGRAGDPVADATALSGLERFLTLDDLRIVREQTSRVEVLWRPLRVHIRNDVEIAFADAPVPGVALTVRADLDRHNLRSLSPGDLVGWVSGEGRWPIETTGRSGRDLSPELFALHGNELRMRREVVPVMVTTQANIAKSDCLFYALERRPATG